MQWVGIVKTRKKIFITINMTTIARRFYDGMQKRRYVNKTMGTAQPARQIRRFQCQVDARIGVGVKWRQGGEGGRVNRRCIFAQTLRAIGVTVFFLATRCARLHA